MKNLYSKGKGKIHPSPASPSAAAGGSCGDALAVLRILPAAILALTAAMCYEDKEVLAYLITRSIDGPTAMLPDGGEERLSCRRAAKGVHRPVFHCGCFDCYTSFWSRWDCSPNRELIHQAIEAFEEHLATSEKKSGRGRRRERRAVDKAVKKDKAKKERKKAEVVEAVVVSAAEDKEEMKAPGEKEMSPFLSRAESFSSEENSPVVVAAEEVMEAAAAAMEKQRMGTEEEQEVVAVAGERRRGWPDLMGLFNSRLWSLWSPAA